MKAAFISMWVVLIISVVLCLMSMYIHADVLDRMDILCDSAIECVRSDEKESAGMYAEKLEKTFGGRKVVLEMLASHNDIHETMNCVTDAKVALECGDMDDAYQALIRLKGMISHLRDHEGLSLANLL